MRPTQTDQQTDTHDGEGVQLAGLAADSYGVDDDRAPLVLLHGLTFDRRTWAPVVKALREIDPRRRVLVVDLPGHGASAPLPSHDIESVADVVHRAVIEAGLHPPVVVGHSIGAVIATFYAVRHPASGVVNVDQSLQVVGFARLLHSLADRLRGPDFPSVWEMFRTSFHTELLPPDAQELVRSTSHPDQNLVLGYWRALLEIDPAGLEAWSDSHLGLLLSLRCPYVLVVHDEFGSEEQRWLHEALPQASVAVWPNTGHFPHLAHPRLFAEYLAATDRWPEVLGPPARPLGDLSDTDRPMASSLAGDEVSTEHRPTGKGSSVVRERTVTA